MVYVAYDSSSSLLTNELTSLARARDPRFTYHFFDIDIDNTDCRRFFAASIEGCNFLTLNFFNFPLYAVYGSHAEAIILETRALKTGFSAPFFQI